jgi:hypothetical protein
MSLNTHLNRHEDSLCSPVFHCRLRIKGPSLLQHLLLSYCIYDLTTAFAAVKSALLLARSSLKKCSIFFKKKCSKKACSSFAVCVYLRKYATHSLKEAVSDASHVGAASMSAHI